MSLSYVGVDLGSSNFHQVALNHAGTSTLNRESITSEANLIKAFSDQRGEIWVHLEAGELAPWAAEVIGRWWPEWFVRIRRAMPGSPKTRTSAVASTPSSWPIYCG